MCRRPLLYRNIEVKSPFFLPRILVYILPALAVSLLLNIPKFLEFEVRRTWTDNQLNLTLNYTHEAPTALRLSQDYITYYLHGVRSS